MSIKTEAALGNREYSPVVAIATAKEDYDPNWEKTYRTFLIENIKSFKSLNVKKHFDEFVLFNNNLDDPRWLWDESKLAQAYIWRLNDVHTFLSNLNAQGKVVK